MRPEHAAGVVAALIAPALTPAGATAAEDADAVLAQFRHAAARGDAPALAALAVQPFLFEGRPVDRDTVRRTVVPALMTPAVRRCLATAPAVDDQGQRGLWCAPYGFLFDRTAEGWRWSGFVADTP